MGPRCVAVGALKAKAGDRETRPAGGRQDAPEEGASGTGPGGSQDAMQGWLGEGTGDGLVREGAWVHIPAEKITRKGRTGIRDFCLSKLRSSGSGLPSSLPATFPSLLILPFSFPQWLPHIKLVPVCFIKVTGGTLC